MSKKNRVILTLIILGALGLTVFKVTCQVDAPIVVVKPVTVKKLAMTNYDVSLNYVGRVESSSLKKLSFKSTGKVESIKVAVGDRVNAGDQLMILDQEDLIFAKNAAENQMKVALAQYEKVLKGTSSEELKNAKSNVEKAQEIYNDAQKQLDHGKLLYESGGISKDALDQLTLNLNLQAKNLDQAEQLYQKAKRGAEPEDVAMAQANYLMAKTDFESKQSLLEDAVLRAPVSGTIVSILYEADETVPAGYPAVVIREDSQIIKVGVTGEDLKKIKLGQEFLCTDLALKGSITRLAEVPDASTHLYEIEATLKNSDLLIGEIVECRLLIGEASGVIIPIESILNDGEDFVFLYEEGYVTRQVVHKSEIIGNQILVSGLNAGDLLISKNINQLKDGELVSLMEQ
ncbi:efflux RND transporter periplasmic adaptor subunit [Fusibacter ferrireducens]|uniref:HlyD family efflux transporter periplasmic adaptor subunit n=1 Tax=Fusibacter ferrireducens TaxID=2785058 RepID=A0ABR9ZPM2_9FIRM|nr:biotin/lipoyl-binding protein [Fusibacter ferrireducens]MBF4691579.1 HlyD family efflux transporter periplasmic adaptor subunit [Fusibacter ferrireducens]